MCDPDLSWAITQLLNAILKHDQHSELPDPIWNAACDLAHLWGLHRCNGKELYEQETQA